MASLGGSQSVVVRRVLPWAAALALHAVFFIIAGLLITPQLDFIRPERKGEKVFDIVRMPPPPPRLAGALAEMTTSIMPRFRPRYHLPKGVLLSTTTQRGSAAEALFRYWCSNRPDTIEATGRLCPPGVPFNGLAALPDRALVGNADASSLLGAADQGYTVDEAAVRRGWIKPKPPTGQDALKAKTDKTTGAKPDEVHGGFPWEATPTGR